MTNEELRKSLEEAADRFVYKRWLNCPYPLMKVDCKIDFKAGAEFGYKEAIKEAKEWLEKKAHFAKAQYCNCEESEDDYYSGKVYGLEEALADFETDMNTLLEEKK